MIELFVEILPSVRAILLLLPVDLVEGDHVWLGTPSMLATMSVAPTSGLTRFGLSVSRVTGDHANIGS